MKTRKFSLLLIAGIASILAVVGCTGEQAKLVKDTVEPQVSQAQGAKLTASPGPTLIKPSNARPTGTSVVTVTSAPTASPATTFPSKTTPTTGIEASPRLLACVKEALGDNQYDAIVAGAQSVSAQQTDLLMPCMMQYPKEVESIMNKFGLTMESIMGQRINQDQSNKGPRGTAPTIQEMGCTPVDPSIGAIVQCSFRYSGKVVSISWEATGGSPEIGKEKKFASSFDQPGSAIIALQICNASGCADKVTELDVSDTQKTASVGGPRRSVFHTSLEGCSGQGPPVFSSLPIPKEAISWIEPLGKMNPMAGHVTPTDHIYIHYIDSLGYPPSYELRALADGYIVDVERRPDWTPENAEVLGVLKDWRLVFEHTCTFFSVYIHVKELEPDVLNAPILEGPMRGQTLRDLDSIAGSELKDMIRSGVRIPVEAGQIIGKVGGQLSFDIQVTDMDVTLPGFVLPEHYTEAWKAHTADFFAYLDPQIRNSLLEKNPRSTEPIGGKIDYDVDGRIVGNWFMEGSEDHAGGELKATLGYCGSNPCPYWAGHLSLAYDHLDPAQIRVSNGADWKRGPFGVKGNSPDPAGVSVEDGLVKYELVELQHVRIPGFSNVSKTINYDDEVVGTMLLQMLDDRTMRMEIVPDTSADRVSGFSAEAKDYFR